MHILAWINFDFVRIPGVLQRFAISYFVVAGSCAIIARLCTKEEAEPTQPVSNIFP